MTTVFIWNNNQLTHRFAKITRDASAMHAVGGHTSLSIDDNFSKIFDYSNKEDVNIREDTGYVSWTLDQKFDIQANKLYGYCVESFMLTLMMMNYAPDNIIRIPNPPPPYIARMKQARNQHAYEKKSGLSNHYDFKRKNCARVGSRVLRAGWQKGAGNIRYGQVVSGLWTPLMVKRLALDLQGGPNLRESASLLTWENFIQELFEKGTVGRKTAYLLSLFKRRASNRGTSGATPRIEFQGKQMTKKTGANFLPQLFAYSELRESGFDIDSALDVMDEQFSSTDRLHTNTEQAEATYLALEAAAKKYEATRVPVEFLKGVRVLGGAQAR